MITPSYIIMKFGGTSVKDAFAMSNVLDIIRYNSIQDFSKIIVFSACSGITDKLIKIANDSVNSLELAKLTINEIKEHHLNIITELITNKEISDLAINKINLLINEILLLTEGVSLLNELTNKTYDAIVSIGEILSSSIFYYFALSKDFDICFMPANELILTNSNYKSASVIQDITKFKLDYFLKNNPHKYYITQGFIGHDDNDNRTTLGRGGSDYSAALIGSLLQAEIIDIYTDVDGILTADPRIIQNTKTIRSMTYEEVAEMSFYGAKVIHPDTILPAVKSNIPVTIKNTFNPDGEFTYIFNSNDFTPSINALTLKKDIALIEIQFKDNLNLNHKLEQLVKDFNFYNLFIYALQITNHGLNLLVANSNFLSDALSNNEILNYKISSIDLIILTGNNLCNSNFKHNFINKIGNYSQIKGFTNNSIIIISSPNYSLKLASSLHKEIFG